MGRRADTGPDEGRNPKYGITIAGSTKRDGIADISWLYEPTPTTTAAWLVPRPNRGATLLGWPKVGYASPTRATAATNRD